MESTQNNTRNSTSHLTDVDLFNKAKIPLDYIRSLAIECFAIDKAAHEFVFFKDTSIDIIQLFESIFHIKILNLAIAVRTALDQGTIEIENKTFPDFGSFFRDEEDPKAREVAFSLRDVCNKIIHSEKMVRYLEKSEDQSTTRITGSMNPKEKHASWTLYIDISKVCMEIIRITFTKTDREQ